jgi:hypothetical protein
MINKFGSIFIPSSKESLEKILNVSPGDRHLQLESISMSIEAIGGLFIKTAGHISGRIKMPEIA